MIFPYLCIVGLIIEFKHTAIRRLLASKYASTANTRNYSMLENLGKAHIQRHRVHVVFMLQQNRKELALAAGLSVQDISVGLLGTGVGVIDEQAGLTAPLPAFGLTGAYAFTERWIGRAGLAYFGFSLSLDDAGDLSRESVNANISIKHHTFEHVQCGLQYSFFDVRVEFEDLQRISSIDYSYQSPMLSFNFVF